MQSRFHSARQANGQLYRWSATVILGQAAFAAVVAITGVTLFTTLLPQGVAAQVIAPPAPSKSRSQSPLTVAAAPTVSILQQVNQSEKNLPPTISVTGSKRLLAGEVGYWQVRGRDPEKSALRYAVDWGDGQAQSDLPCVDTSIICRIALASHSYKLTGDYRAVFSVTDALGATAQYPLAITVTSRYQPVR